MYKSLKPITIKALKEAGACSDKLREFSKRAIEIDIALAYSEIPHDVAMNIAKAIGEPTWLIEHGFVEEEKQETFYKFVGKPKVGHSIQIYISDGEIEQYFFIEWEQILAAMKEYNVASRFYE